MTLPTDSVAVDLYQARRFLAEAERLRDNGANETVTRQTLVSGLADTFPANGRPWWVSRHIKGAEQQVRFGEGGTSRRGFVDSLVGLTAIEYESDLRDAHRYTTGRHQVRQYCAGLLNQGADLTKVRGILSDGVEWHAFTVAFATPLSGTWTVEDINLIQVEKIAGGSATEEDAARWVDFLVRYLGRDGTRALTASSIAEYLGFDSGFGLDHLAAFEVAVQDVMLASPVTGDVVRRIWSSFVSFLGTDAREGEFDITVYVQEFYLTVLARLVCANVMERRALHGDPAELETILDGRFFNARGLHRLVEHDYFGWLVSPAHIHRIRSLAAALQDDLRAYDFTTAPDGDLFGEMLALLAQRTKRLLLGQEWTPAWLADRMADSMFDALSEGESPRFVDMCCGSGAMMVAITRRVRQLLAGQGIAFGSPQAIDQLVRAVTGFDIDPLAVALAKVNWVVSNRDWIEPFDGSNSVSVPVYHADSLFALAPVFEDIDAARIDPAADYTLRLLDTSVTLPRFLVAPDTQALFDVLLDRVHSLAMYAATGNESVDSFRVERAVDEAAATSGIVLAAALRHRVVDFVADFIETLAELERQGRNGIWIFVVRNSYRPGLVAGQFNGLISNPPWLAMSKMACNPFAEVLRERAEKYGLTPAGAAAPHLEMATTFLAHAVDHFLAPGAVVACVLPDTVRNGSHHEPFRAQVSGEPAVQPQFAFSLKALWRVEHRTFRNRAIVVLGQKALPSPLDRLDGLEVGAGGDLPIAHYRSGFGGRTVWSSNPPGDGVPGGYPAGFAQQGADIMPRRLLMVSARPTLRGPRTTIQTPTRDGPDWYLMAAAKKHQEFEIPARTLPSRFVHGCFISNHLGPFVLTTPASIAAPIIRMADGTWALAEAADLADDPVAKAHFEQILNESDFDDLDDLWNKGLNFRGKLTKQVFVSGQWIVVYGAGGGIPAAAHARVEALGPTPPLIDQTLYWAVTNEEDEALFLVGVLNCSVLLERIRDFLPGGEFGDRHLHSLPSKAVPQFDATDPTHTGVVQATRNLVREMDGLRDVPETSALFTTQIEMKARRRRIRATIERLPSYGAYHASCIALYVALGG